MTKKHSNISIPLLIAFFSTLEAVHCDTTKLITHTPIAAPCEQRLILRIPLTMPRATSFEKAKNRVVSAFTGILEESTDIIVKASLQEAIRSGNPFAIRGRGSLWPETRNALNQIQEYVDRHPRSSALREAIIEKLRERLSNANERTRRTEQRKKRTGVAPPLSQKSLLKDAPKSPMGLALSPDGRTLIAIGEKGEIVAYSTRSQVPKKRYKKAAIARHAEYRGWRNHASWPIFPIRFLPDSKSFVVAVTTSPTLVLQLFDTQSGKRNFKLEDHHMVNPNAINSRPMTGSLEKGIDIIVANDGSYISYCGGGDNYAATEGTWHLGEKRAVVAYHTRFDASTTGVYSPDNRFYFSANEDLRVIHLKSETELVTPIGRRVSDNDLESYRGHSFGGEISSVILGTKPNTLFGQNLDKRRNLTVVELDYSGLEKAMTGKPFAYKDGSPIDVNGNRKIEYAKKSGINSVNLASKNAPGEDEFFAGGLRLSPDQRFLVSYFHNYDRFGNSGGTNVLTVYMVGRWSRAIKNLGRLHPEKIKKWEFSPDGDYFITLSKDNKLRVFRVEGTSHFQHISTLGGEDNPILNFAVSADSSRIFLIENEQITTRNFYEERAQ